MAAGPSMAVPCLVSPSGRKATDPSGVTRMVVDPSRVGPSASVAGTHPCWLGYLGPILGCLAYLHPLRVEPGRKLRAYRMATTYLRCSSKACCKRGSISYQEYRSSRIRAGWCSSRNCSSEHSTQSWSRLSSPTLSSSNRSRKVRHRTHHSFSWVALEKQIP